MNLPKTEKELKELCVEFANLDRYKPVSTMIEFDKFITERNKTKLYDILTKEQWDVVIEEELICEFWNEPHPTPAPFKTFALSCIEDGRFRPNTGEHNFQHCRIHHSQPQFNTGIKPDWLDDDQMIVARLHHGPSTIEKAMCFSWKLNFDASITRWQMVKV